MNGKLQGRTVRRQALKGRWFQNVKSFENNAEERGIYSVVNGGGHSGRKPDLTRRELSASGLYEG